MSPLDNHNTPAAADSLADLSWRDAAPDPQAPDTAFHVWSTVLFAIHNDDALGAQLLDHLDALEPGLLSGLLEAHAARMVEHRRTLAERDVDRRGRRVWQAANIEACRAALASGYAARVEAACAGLDAVLAYHQFTEPKLDPSDTRERAMVVLVGDHRYASGPTLHAAMREAITHQAKWWRDLVSDAAALADCFGADLPDPQAEVEKWFAQLSAVEIRGPGALALARRMVS